MRIRQALQTFLATALLATAPIAFAQLGAGGFPGAGRGAGMGGPSGPPHTLGRDREEFRFRALEEALHELHRDLRLIPAQESKWQAYVDKVRALAGDIVRERNSRSSAPQPNVLQRLDQIVDAARNRLAALEEITQSAKVLYDGLFPEQRGPENPGLATVVSIALSVGEPRPMDGLRSPAGDFRPPERGGRNRD